MRKVLCAIVVSLFLANSADAALLYDNGAINGTINAWPISLGESTSNSFALASESFLTRVQIGLWVIPGDRPTGLDWSIGTTEFNNDIDPGGTATLTNVLVKPTPNTFGFEILRSTFDISTGKLDAGTYWLTLQNATVASGDQIFWDQNNGPSSAFNDLAGDLSLLEPPASGSESFQIFGDVVLPPSGTIPEPGTFALVGAMAFVALGLRRRANAAA